MNIKKTYGLNKSKIIEQVNREYELSINTVREKREVFRQRFKLYNDQNKDPEKISINLVYATIQSILATTYDDEILVEFLGRTTADQDTAEIWNNLAKFDQEEMGLDKIYHKLQKNRGLTGVGIRVMNSWNEETNTPETEVIDTLSWIPDPNGSYSAQSFRWHGFEIQRTKNELRNDKMYFNVDKIRDKVEEEIERTKRERKQTAGLNYQDQRFSGDNTLCNIYNHYTIIRGEKYWIALANNRSELVGIHKLEPVLKIEKKDPSKIPFPIVLNYFDPEEGNPYGNSLIDLLEDKQRMQSKFANLMMRKAVREGLGHNILYDKNLIPNRTDLTRPSLGPKLIGVDGRKGAINGAMIEMPTAPVPNSNFNLFDFIQQNASLSTGLDARSLGVSVGQNITATEAQQIQANANLRLILLNKVNFWGEKEFWELWYREYKANFKKEKYIRIKTGLGVKPITIKQDKFDTLIDPDVKISSKAETKAKRKQEGANLMALLPLIEQNPNIPEISKLLYLRNILKYNGVDNELIEIYVPPTVDEKTAYEELNLLNNNELWKPLISSLDQDHLAYIIIYSQALNTDAKYTAIEARWEAYKASKQQAQMQQQQQQQGRTATQNMATNQLLSNATQNQQEPISRADVTTGG